MTAVQVETISKQILFRKNSPFVEVTTQQKKKLKREDRICRKLAQLVICTDNEINAHLVNVLDVDL